MLRTGIRLSIVFIFLGVLAACGADPGSQQDGGFETEGEGAESSECETLNGEACEVLIAVNQERAKQGLSSLRFSTKCQSEVQAHALDMVQRNFFAHDTLKA